MMSLIGFAVAAAKEAVEKEFCPTITASHLVTVRRSMPSVQQAQHGDPLLTLRMAGCHAGNHTPEIPHIRARTWDECVLNRHVSPLGMAGPDFHSG